MEYPITFLKLSDNSVRCAAAFLLLKEIQDRFETSRIEIYVAKDNILEVEEDTLRISRKTLMETFGLSKYQYQMLFTKTHGGIPGLTLLSSGRVSLYDFYKPCIFKKAATIEQLVSVRFRSREEGIIEIGMQPGLLKLPKIDTLSRFWNIFRHRKVGRPSNVVKLWSFLLFVPYYTKELTLNNLCLFSLADYWSHINSLSCKEARQFAKRYLRIFKEEGYITDFEVGQEETKILWG